MQGQVSTWLIEALLHNFWVSLFVLSVAYLLFKLIIEQVHLKTSIVETLSKPFERWQLGQKSKIFVYALNFMLFLVLTVLTRYLFETQLSAAIFTAFFFALFERLLFGEPEAYL
ncbi:hypothetical protein ACR6HW_04660 [Fusibacter sp. JL298sf-3]